MKNPESLSAPICYGINQENLSVEVLDVVRGIYSGVTGRDITRKERNGSLPPPVDFLLLPESILSKFAWGHQKVEYTSGSDISPSTKLIVEQTEGGLVVFRIDHGALCGSDPRSAVMNRKFNREVNQYLREQGIGSWG